MRRDVTGKLVCPNPKCGTFFQPRSRRQKYCSTRCSRNVANNNYMYRNKEAVYARNKQWRISNPEKNRTIKRAHALVYKPRQKFLIQRARIETPWKGLLSSAKYRCGKNGWPYNLSDEWAAARWTGFCELSGLRFELGQTPRTPFSPSIDRINPAESYVQSNCRFVLFCVNTFKMNFSDEHMYIVAQALITRDHKDLLPDRFSHIVNNSTPFFHTNPNNTC